MKKVLIVFSAVMLLSSFGVAFADGDAANLFKTHCQSAADLLKKLEGYKDGSFGAQRKLVMENVVKQLSDEQLKSLADYASTL